MAARDRSVRLHGLTFHFLDWGIAGGLPLVLLHGGAQTAHSWDEVAPELARDHHVLAFDQRGHGDTDWSAGGAYARRDFVGDIGAFLDHQGWPEATLIGLSLGGLNAIAFATARPERVRGLVVVDVVPTIAPGGREAIGTQLAVREFASFEEAVDRARTFNPRRSVENIRERLGHGMRPLPDGRWTYKFDPAIAGGTAEADLDRLWRDVRGLRGPVLLVRGAESPILTVEGVARFLREARDSRVAEVPGAGHSVMGDNPAGFLAAVRPFLARHEL